MYKYISAPYLIADPYPRQNVTMLIYTYSVIVISGYGRFIIYFLFYYC